ncbi:hypothetical protein FDP41_011820 [Naegleria fowleri]|uniref:Uncharacterized protein n=1 Tax=Naegleria fowleri TaxID=5763 RepID=A0A6A5C9M4_NAEFO|nr:uncharacterized protein FDP41_011820 [Naegleria fowleri]KAF0981959.1 hypothetical protein FDP41_011820 [Naegleria fowleri]
MCGQNVKDHDDVNDGDRDPSLGDFESSQRGPRGTLNHPQQSSEPTMTTSTTTTNITTQTSGGGAGGGGNRVSRSTTTTTTTTHTPLSSFMNFAKSPKQIVPSLALFHLLNPQDDHHHHSNQSTVLSLLSARTSSSLSPRIKNTGRENSTLGSLTDRPSNKNVTKSTLTNVHSKSESSLELSKTLPTCSTEVGGVENDHSQVKTDQTLKCNTTISSTTLDHSTKTTTNTTTNIITNITTTIPTLNHTHSNTPSTPRRFPRVEFSNHAIKLEKKILDSTQTIRIHKEHEDRVNLVHECIKQIHSPCQEQVQLGIAALKEIDAIDYSIRYDEYQSPYEKKLSSPRIASFSNVHSKYLESKKKQVVPKQEETFSPQLISKQFKNTSPRYLDYIKNEHVQKSNKEIIEQMKQEALSKRIQSPKNESKQGSFSKHSTSDINEASPVSSPQRFSSSKLYPQHHSRYHPLYYSPKKGVKLSEQLVSESTPHSKPSSPMKGVSSPIASKSPQIVPKVHLIRNDEKSKKVNDNLKLLMESGSLDDYNDEFEILHKSGLEDSEILSYTLENNTVEDDDLVVTDPNITNMELLRALSPPPIEENTTNTNESMISFENDKYTTSNKEQDVSVSPKNNQVETMIHQELTQEMSSDTTMITLPDSDIDVASSPKTQDHQDEIKMENTTSEDEFETMDADEMSMKKE